MAWTVFCWETLNSIIHMERTLLPTMYLNIFEDQIHSFMTTVFYNGRDLS